MPLDPKTALSELKLVSAASLSATIVRVFLLLLRGVKGDKLFLTEEELIHVSISENSPILTRKTWAFHSCLKIAISGRIAPKIIYRPFHLCLNLVQRQKES
jgi:hypothetical protein